MTRLRRLWADNFLRSSGLLLANTFIASFLGFAFWALAARRYSAHTVGEAAALFAVVTFVSNFSLLGLNTAVIRFLPTSRNRDSMLSTAITGVSLAAAAGAAVWLVGRHVFTPSVSISLSAVTVVGVTAIFTLFSLNVAVDSAFLAHAKPEYIVAKNSIVAAIRIAVLLPVTAAGGYLLFVVATAPSAAGAVGALVLLVRRFGHRLRPRIDAEFMRTTARFCAGNYLSVTFKSLPAMVVPVLLASSGHPASAAYFYVAWSIANLLYVAVMSVNLTFLAEGARQADQMTSLILKAVKVNGVLLVLLIAGTLGIAPVILAIFGPQYAVHASSALIYLVVTAVFVAVIQGTATILNLQERVGTLTLLSIVEAATVIGLVVQFRDRGIDGVGLGWLCGYGFTAATCVIVIFIRRRRDIAERTRLRVSREAAIQQQM